MVKKSKSKIKPKIRIVKLSKEKRKINKNLALIVGIIVAVIILVLILAIFIWSSLKPGFLPSPGRGIPYLIDSNAAGYDPFYCNEGDVVVGAKNSPLVAWAADKLYCVEDDITADQTNKRIINSNANYGAFFCDRDEVVCGARTSFDRSDAVKDFYCCKTNYTVNLDSIRLVDSATNGGVLMCNDTEVVCGGKNYYYSKDYIDQIYCCEYALTDFVAYYNFENNVDDQSGNNHNGVIYGNPEYVPGISGQGMYFDGNGDYVNVSLPTRATSNVSMLMWVYIPEFRDKGAFLKIGAYQGYGVGVGASHFENYGNDLIGVYENHGYWLDSNIRIGSGWHHIGFVINESRRPSLYLDGKLVKSWNNEYSDSDVYDPLDSALIGGYNMGTGRFFNGTIDEVKIYTRKLSESEILADYENLACGDQKCDQSIGETRQTCSEDCGVVYYLDFDEESGEICYDSSGYSYNATIKNGASRVAGKKGNALLFDGTNDWVDVGRIPNVASLKSNFTMEFWVQPRVDHQIDAESNANGALGGIAGQKYAIGTEAGYLVWGSGSGGVAAGAAISVGTNGVSVYEHDNQHFAPVLVWQGTLSNDDWTHVAVVYEEDRSKLYIDGENVRNGTPQAFHRFVYPGGYNYNNDDGLGRTDTRGWFDGKLDELKIWNYALDADGVVNAYNAIYCGNDSCDENIGEDCLSCEEDCGACVQCGDGVCDMLENISSCAADCSGVAYYIYKTPSTIITYLPSSSIGIYYNNSRDICNIGRIYGVKRFLPSGAWEETICSNPTSVNFTLQKGEGYIISSTVALFNSTINFKGVQEISSGFKFYNLTKINGEHGQFVLPSNWGGRIAEELCLEINGLTGIQQMDFTIGNWRGHPCGTGINNYLLNASKIVFIATDKDVFWSPTGKVLELKFDEGIGSVSYDSSGYGGNATLYNGVNWTSGVFGNATLFDGVDDYGNSIFLQNYNLSRGFTTSVWIKPRSLNYNEFLWLNNGSFDSDTSFIIGMRNNDSSGKLACFLQATEPNIYYYAKTSQCELNEWCFVNCVYNGSNLIIYKNGVEGGVSVAIPNPSVSLGKVKGMRIGTWSLGYNYFNGSIDEVKIWSKGLSEEEIILEYLDIMCGDGECTGVEDISNCPADCVSLPDCGNNTIESPEICDGIALAGENCTTLGYDNGTLSCLGDCSNYDLTGCYNFSTAVCHDSLIQGTEVCDNNNLSLNNCTTRGYTAGNLSCLSDCSDYNVTQCFSVCSNGKAEIGEACDGSDLDGYNCRDHGFDGGTLKCESDCDFDTSDCTNDDSGNPPGGGGGGSGGTHTMTAEQCEAGAIRKLSTKEKLEVPIGTTKQIFTLDKVNATGIQLKLGSKYYYMNKFQTKNFDVAGDAQADFTLKLNSISPKVEVETKCIVSGGGGTGGTETENCTDSDGGIDYDTVGFITGKDEEGYSYNNQAEACLNTPSSTGDEVIASDYLGEFYCEDGLIKADFYTCPYGCDSGICKEAPEEPGDSWFWIIILGLMIPIIALIIIVVMIILKEKKRGFSKKEVKPNPMPPRGPGPMTRPGFPPQAQPRNLNFPGRGS